MKICHRAADGDSYRMIHFPTILLSSAKCCKDFYCDVWKHIQRIVYPVQKGKEETAKEDEKGKGEKGKGEEKGERKDGESALPSLNFDSLPFTLKWVNSRV